MSTLVHGHGAIERRHTGNSPVFQRPAELVDISERLYRRIFAVGLWLAAALCAFAAMSSLLHATAGSQLRGLTVCALCAVACCAAALRPAPVYTALRRRPRLLLIAGSLVGFGAWFVGPDNFQLFLPIIAVLSVPGIATPWRVVAAAGVIAGLGLAAPQLLDGDANLAGPIVLLVPPLLLWLIVDRIAVFALRLHQSLGTAEDGSGVAGSVPPTSATRSPPPSDPLEPHGLPMPRAIEVDGVRLTARQLQVILLCAEGLEHEEIGACLEVGGVQVGRHLRNACRSVEVATTAELVAWAIGRGLIPRDDAT